MNFKERKRTVGVSLVTIVVFFCSLAMSAQELPGHQVVTKGSMPNNDSVPEVYTLETSFKRIIVVRMKYQKDILQGLQEAVAKEHIQNGVILSGVGSVIRYHLHAVDNTIFPSENIFWENNEPMDITAMNGYIIDGRVHAHMTLANEQMAIGGHLEPRTKVFTFCVITIGELADGTSLKRLDDKTWR